jgi:hypothetical protein
VKKEDEQTKYVAMVKRNIGFQEQDIVRVIFQYSRLLPLPTTESSALIVLDRCWKYDN